MSTFVENILKTQVKNTIPHLFIYLVDLIREILKYIKIFKI